MASDDEKISPEEFDLIVCGTGLQEALMAGCALLADIARCLSVCTTKGEKECFEGTCFDVVLETVHCPGQRLKQERECYTWIMRDPMDHSGRRTRWTPCCNGRPRCNTEMHSSAPDHPHPHSEIGIRSWLYSSLPSRPLVFSTAILSMCTDAPFDQSSRSSRCQHCLMVKRPILLAGRDV